jgi:fermentation-respiration switch protein FrsA (DUF1100 family)
LAVVLLSVALLLYLAALGVLWYKQDDLLFGRRTQDIIETPQQRGWTYEDVVIEVSGGTTHGWWIPLDNARATVLFSHGSGRNISGYLDDVELFRELGLNVLLYDYGGYGQSTGAPSEARCYADIEVMWEYLVDTRGIASGEIILCGSSMGSGVTTELAVSTPTSPKSAGQAATMDPSNQADESTRDIASESPRAGKDARDPRPATSTDATGGMSMAVVLESAFTSIPDTITADYPYIPARWICRSQFRSIDKVARIQSPILIIHSQEDTVVPFSHGKALYEAAKEPKLFVEITGAHYGGKFSSKEAYLAGWEKFLEKVQQSPVSEHGP